MKKIELWLPTLFCMFISVATLIPIMYISRDSVYIPFFCFLPLSFFMVGIVLTKMNKEIARLRQQIEEIQETRK